MVSLLIYSAGKGDDDLDTLHEELVIVHGVSALVERFSRHRQSDAREGARGKGAGVSAVVRGSYVKEQCIICSVRDLI